MDKRAIFLSAARQFKRCALTGLCLLVAGCAASGQGEPEDSSALRAEQVQFHIATAERLVDVGEYDSALDEYLAAARLSGDAEVARNVTRLSARVQDWEAAASAASRWLELEPDAENAHHVGILALANQGQVEKAAAAMRRWLEMEDEASATRYWRRASLLLSAAVDDESALAVLRELADSDGAAAPVGELDHAQSLLLWRQGRQEAARRRAEAASEASNALDHLEWAAQLAVEEGQLERALSLYRRAADQAGERGVALALAQAEVLRQLERDEEAIELLGSLPENSQSLHTLGLYLVQLDRTVRAESVWERMAGLPEDRQSSNHAFLVAQLAELLERDGDALEWYARVGQEADEARRAQLRRAIVLGRLERVEEARSLLTELRESADEDERHRTWLIEAEILRSAGRPEDAIAFLAEPLAERPGSIDLLYARALSAALAGDIDLAEQDLRRIIQMDGDNAMALNALGYTMADQTDRLQEAYRLISRALELDPDDPATLDSMGWVLYRLGRAEEAVEYLQRALDGDENPEIMAHLIEVLDHLGRREEARDLAERASADHPDDAYLETTLERIGYSR